MKTFGCQRHLRELKGKCHGLNCVPCPNSYAGVLTPRTAERALQGSGPSRRCHRETGLAEGAPSPLHRPHRRELQTQRRTCEEGAGVGHAGAWGRPALPAPWSRTPGFQPGRKQPSVVSACPSVALCDSGCRSWCRELQRAGVFCVCQPHSTDHLRPGRHRPSALSARNTGPALVCY